MPKAIPNLVVKQLVENEGYKLLSDYQNYHGKLIRIPYWDFNKIKNILRKELNV